MFEGGRQPLTPVNILKLIHRRYPSRARSETHGADSLVHFRALCSPFHPDLPETANQANVHENGPGRSHPSAHGDSRAPPRARARRSPGEEDGSGRP